MSSSSSLSSSFPPYRVILLLDMDCFYAQCERVRLFGLKNDVGSTTSLALLQWNSVLAVTYPARTLYNIQRGDSWNDVRAKSNGSCLAIHLPIIPKKPPKKKKNSTNNMTTTTSLNTPPINEQEQVNQEKQHHHQHIDDDDDNDYYESIETAYAKEYQLSQEERQFILETTVGVQRYPHEGKACLDRYRCASARIFGVILDTLTVGLEGRENFVLERASIDELFLDITSYCWNNNNDSHIMSTLITTTVDEAMKQTVIVGNHHHENEEEEEEQLCKQRKEDDSDVVMDTNRALQRGCAVAMHIRKTVYDTLGFTLSAGIGTSKLVAKLGATYGKPNGQAVIFPCYIPHLMEQTELRKARNLGGKLGKQVISLLPPNQPTTLASIEQNLTLSTLSNQLGRGTAQMVWNACRGMDDEPVKETIGALVKSITAFKSFPKTSITSNELVEWITLLATDVVGRVLLDANRNHRYPKNCTIQYAVVVLTRNETSGRTVHTKSLRVPFPKQQDGCTNNTNNNVKTKLVQRAKDALLAKEGRQVYISRFGLCAMDFSSRRKHGEDIASFFTKMDPKIMELGCRLVAKSSASQQDGEDANVDAAATTTTQQSQEKQQQQQQQQQLVASLQPEVNKKDANKDMELARKLQVMYDREDYVLTTAEKRRQCTGSSSSSGKQSRQRRRQDQKVRRIDNFFHKKATSKG